MALIFAVVSGNGSSSHCLHSCCQVAHRASIAWRLLRAKTSGCCARRFLQRATVALLTYRCVLALARWRRRGLFHSLTGWAHRRELGAKGCQDNGSQLCTVARFAAHLLQGKRGLPRGAYASLFQGDQDVAPESSTAWARPPKVSPYLT